MCNAESNPNTHIYIKHVMQTIGIAQGAIHNNNRLVIEKGLVIYTHTYKTCDADGEVKLSMHIQYTQIKLTLEKGII